MRGWMLLGYKFPEFDNIISLSTCTLSLSLSIYIYIYIYIYITIQRNQGNTKIKKEEARVSLILHDVITNNLKE